MNSNQIHRICFLLLLLVTTPSVMAENSTSNTAYTVHHNALKSDFISPAIAKSYNIQRSKFRGLLNISVVKKVSGSTGTTTKASIEVKASNLSGIPKEIQLREIVEQDAIYYIGDFPVTNREIVNFNLKVIPVGEDKPILARFSQQFYID